MHDLKVDLDKLSDAGALNFYSHFFTVFQFCQMNLAD